MSIPHTIPGSIRGFLEFFNPSFLIARTKRGATGRYRFDVDRRLVDAGKPQQAIIQAIMSRHATGRKKVPALSRQISRQLERRDANANRVTATQKHRRSRDSGLMVKDAA